MINRCHIQCAAEYLDYIKHDYDKKQIKNTIADITDYVSYFDNNEDVDFVVLSTNALPSKIYYLQAQDLFYKYNLREQFRDSYSIHLISVYNLRLALESRIKGLLGIDYVLTNGKPIGLKNLIDISKNLKSIKYDNEINWQEIVWLNEWINHYIHRALRPYSWMIHQGFEVLKILLNPKKAIINKSRKTYSIYSATIVEDELAFKTEVENTLKNRFKNVEIFWMIKSEILLQ